MNVLLINVEKAKLTPLYISEYLRSKNINCYSCLGKEADILGTIRKFGLRPDNTVIHARTAGPHVTEIYRMLEKRGFKVINKSSTTGLTSDKYKSQLFARKHGIPTPDTFKVRRTDVQRIKLLANKYGSIVLKPIYSKGNGIYCHKITKDTNVKQIARIAGTIPGKEIIAQQFVRYQKLVRAIMIGYKLLSTATTYDKVKSDWKTSVCMNPDIYKYTGNQRSLKLIAERTARVFRGEISFIDFYEVDRGRYILNELNTACGLIVQENTTRIKIHRHIADYLISALEKLPKSAIMHKN